MTKQSNVLPNQIIQIERKPWSNEQYSRRECLDIPKTVTDSSLEETALNILEEMGVTIDHSEIEVCNHVGPSSCK